MNTLVSSVRGSEMWMQGRGAWFAVVFSLALGCGKSVRESSEGSAGTAGTGAGAAGRFGSDHDDFIIASSLMSEYEGLRVYATFDFTSSPNTRSDARMAVITNGSFELVWEEGFDRNSFGAYVTLFVDRGNDVMCTTDVDPAWVDFLNNISPPGGPEILDFDPEVDSVTFGPITCDEFNTWFDEDFRPPPP